MELKFRDDINGLRALAVLPVLLFHAEIPQFNGGFLGVDVFFVISGYLITLGLIHEIVGKNFSLIRFYDRRARRIAPALLLVLIVTTILAFFFMLPYDLKNFGQSLVATLSSANNILLYLTSGYWDLAADFKPLSHTWSLSVEEQFYVILPVLLLLVTARKNVSYLLIALLVPCVSSYFVSLIATNSEFDFLMLSNRAWQLLSGASLAAIMFYAGSNRIYRSTPLVVAGLSLLAISYTSPFLISDRPAVYRLVPVTGALLVIACGSKTSIVSRLLGAEPFKSIGLWSYSIYLWHMPLIVGVRLSSSGPVNHDTLLVAAAISIPLAAASWRYLEVPFRDRNLVSSTRFYAAVVSSFVVLLVIGIVLHFSYGLQRYRPHWSYGIDPQRFCDEAFNLMQPRFVDDNKKNLLILGNSFARDVANMMVNAGVGEKYEIAYFPKEIPSDDVILGEDANFLPLVRSADVILTASSAGLGGSVDLIEVKIRSEQVLEYLRSNTDAMLLRVGTKNFGYNNNFVLRMSYNRALNQRVTPNASVRSANEVEKNVWGDAYLDLLAAVSSEDGEVPLFTPSGRFISFDTDHATCEGATYLGHSLILKTLLGEELGISKREGSIVKMPRQPTSRCN